MPSISTERILAINIISGYSGLYSITDLGSGWGGLAQQIAERFPEQQITAIERSLMPYLFSKLTSRLKGHKNISHYRENMFERTLKDNEAYLTYLSGPVMKALRKSFERDQPSGGLLISIAFAMQGWSPSRVEYAGGRLNTPIYVYEF